MSWFGGRRTSAVRAYRNLDLEVYDYARDGETERAKVRVFDSPVGGQPPGEAERVAFPAGLRPAIKRLETRDLDLEGLIRLGEDLAAVLLPPAARDFYSRSLDRLEKTEGLRIRLRLGTWALATLPWEYAFVEPRGASPNEKVPLGFMTLNRRLSLVRYEILAAPQESLEPVSEDRLRLLALSAEPKGTADLALEREVEAIGHAAAKISGLSFESHPHATWANLQGALDQSAHILHFAGHGAFSVEMGEDYGTLEGRGALLFETADGQADSRPAEEVALNLNQTGVRLVVLAACEGGKVDGVRAWSGIAPALARSGVPAVVAMQFRIRDDKALAFSRRFYENLAGRGSIDSAVTAARLAMFDSNDAYGRDWGAPVLYLNAREGEPFPRPASDSDDEVPLTGRLAANAGIGLGAFALAVLYYLLHLEPRFSSSYLLGGASLPVLLTLIFVVADRLLGTSILGSVRAWLQQRSATKWLAAAAGLVFALGLGTSSIYLVPDDPLAGGIRSVAVTSDNSVLEEEWTIGDSAQGRILFFRVWRPAPVTLSPEQGSGYVEATRTLYPWTSVRQRVPADFPAKRLTLLQLAPIRSIAQKLWSGRARLRVSRNGAPPIEATRFPRGSILLGDRAVEMESALEGQAAELEEEQGRILTESFPALAGSHGRWITVWQTRCTDCLEQELLFEPDDEVLVEVVEATGNSPDPPEPELLFSQKITLDDEPFRVVVLSRD